MYPWVGCKRWSNTGLTLQLHAMQWDGPFKLGDPVLVQKALNCGQLSFSTSPYKRDVLAKRSASLLQLSFIAQLWLGLLE